MIKVMCFYQTKLVSNDKNTNVTCGKKIYKRWAYRFYQSRKIVVSPIIP